MAKFTVLRRRSGMALMASGAATINLYQGAHKVKTVSTAKALYRDQLAIRSDAKRAYKKIRLELESA